MFFPPKARCCVPAIKKEPPMMLPIVTGTCKVGGVGEKVGRKKEREERKGCVSKWIER